MSERLMISMLGEFSLQWNNEILSDTANRQKKIWLLLAYLIYNRRNNPTQENFLALLRDSGDYEIEDPAGRLKALFYRARNLLNQLDENAGHSWITRKNGQYAWNTDIELILDVEEFDDLCSRSAKSTDTVQKLELDLKALALYNGDFLPKLSTEPWVMPISVYYHQKYLDLVMETLHLLEKQNDWKQSSSLCEKALTIEPYSEELYQSLMKAQLALDDRPGVLNTYEKMSELLFTAFGIMPSEESRAFYREATREIKDHSVPMESVHEHLKETVGNYGAISCEYDYFRFLYQVQARSIVRTGDTIHIVLLSLHSGDGKELARRSLDYAMDNLQDICVNSLRQGDVLTKFSASQLLIMLPQANYENSQAVCQRLIKAFNRKYPHSPVTIHSTVHPLEPLVTKPQTE